LPKSWIALNSLFHHVRDAFLYYRQTGHYSGINCLVLAAAP
jgi:hypothetical protein